LYFYKKNIHPILKIMHFNFHKDLILENDRTRLTPLQLADATKLHPIALVEKDLLLYSPSQIHTEELLAQYIQKALDQKEAQNRYPFLIYDKQLKQFAGSTSFGNIVDAQRRLEIGWTWIGKKFQRTGLNRNNKFLMLQYAFEVLGYERVELKTDGKNIQSRTAMERIGATFEGALRSHTIMPAGYRRDTCYYSILKSEWPVIKKKVFKN